MHPPPHYFCRLGTIDWEHGAWIGSFYPEDLPAEWRLTFYNTQFDCVYLPYPRWGHVERQLLAAWAEDTLERFVFLLEHPSGPLSAEDERRLALLDPKAVLLSPAHKPRLVWFDRVTDLAALAEAVQARLKDPPVYLVSLDGDLSALERVRELMTALGC